MIKWFHELKSIAIENHGIVQNFFIYMHLLRDREIIEELFEDGFNIVKRNIIKMVYGTDSMRIFNEVYRNIQYNFKGIGDYCEALNENLCITASS